MKKKILIIAIVIILLSVGICISRFVSNFALTSDLAIATPIIEVETDTDLIEIIDYNEYTTTFIVKNYNSSQISDVSISYNIQFVLEGITEDEIEMTLTKNGTEIAITDNQTKYFNLPCCIAQDDVYVLTVKYVESSSVDYSSLTEISGIIKIEVSSYQSDGSDLPKSLSATLISTASDDTDDGLWASSLTNDGYRYVGTDPDNYICFGTDDVDECLADTDQYLYRIIGVFADSSGEYHLKLIKKEVLNTYYYYGWDSGYTTDTDWEDTKLYNGLNGSYFLTSSDYSYMQDNTWNNLITDWTWTAVNTLSVSASYGLFYRYNTSEQVYYHESNQTSLITGTCYYNASTTATCTAGAWTTTTAKIGLMYVSDYLLSLGSSALNLTSSSNYSTFKTGWMYLGSDEWTISRIGVEETAVYGAYYVLPNGTVSYVDVDIQLSARPVFYLESDVALASGDGSSSNPYMIQTGASDDEEGYYVYFTGDVDTITAYIEDEYLTDEIVENEQYLISLEDSLQIDINEGYLMYYLTITDTTTGNIVLSNYVEVSTDISSEISIESGHTYEISVSSLSSTSYYVYFDGDLDAITVYVTTESGKNLYEIENIKENVLYFVPYNCDIYFVINSGSTSFYVDGYAKHQLSKDIIPTQIDPIYYFKLKDYLIIESDDDVYLTITEAD